MQLQDQSLSSTDVICDQPDGMSHDSVVNARIAAMPADLAVLAMPWPCTRPRMLVSKTNTIVQGVDGIGLAGRIHAAAPGIAMLPDSSVAAVRQACLKTDTIIVPYPVSHP
ncbi:MAG: hypothetical protein WAZ48_12690 [Lysobacteraceae bacterium]